MKSKIIAVMAICIFAFNLTYAHSLWIETKPLGKPGQEQKINIFFGEFGKQKKEKIEARFKEVEGFSIWVIQPDGVKIMLQPIPAKDHYETAFTPAQPGAYRIVLENKIREVADWSNTSGKIGITKQNYYATALVKVGDQSKQSTEHTPDVNLHLRKPESVSSASSIVVQLSYKGNPVSHQKLVIRAPETADIEVMTDPNGLVSFNIPKKGLYVITVVLRFDEPGTYHDVHYDVFREKATLSFIAEK